jgi:hypothetical protein
VTPLTSGGLGRTRLVLMQGEYEARRLSYEEIALDRLGHLSPKGHAVASEIIQAVIHDVRGAPWSIHAVGRPPFSPSP